MKPAPFTVIAAVKDLYDLYTRINPRGPYRLSLFGDTAGISADWPAPLQDRAARLDGLIRGVGCALGNDLAVAGLAVTVALWGDVRRLEQEVSAGLRWREPAYYRFLTHELAQCDGSDPGQVYRLFGEVLAVYLDIICDMRPGYRGEYGALVRQLRLLITQTGENSSLSTSGSD